MKTLNKNAAPILVGLLSFAGRIGYEYAKTLMNGKVVAVIPAEPEDSEMNGEVDADFSYLLGGDFKEPLTNNFVPETLTLLDEVEHNKVNIFTVPTLWDEEHERAQRTSENPYVITVDEYVNDEFGLKQTTVTYYEEDDILADVNDVPIYNWTALLGDLKWGHGSNNKDVVYIRNEKHKQEWEVMLHHGSYEVEVQGLHEEDGELKHTQHRVLKFREY